jgi:hypothetical protein
MGAAPETETARGVQLPSLSKTIRNPSPTILWWYFAATLSSSFLLPLHCNLPLMNC